MKIFKKAKRGFTLVELVVVIAVIAILAAVSVGAYFGVTESANKSKLEQESKQFHTAIQTVALVGNENHTLNADGLHVSDIDKFELALEESMGQDVEVLNSDPTYIAKQTVVLKTSELVKSEEGAPVVYKTFEYYTAEISGKKIAVDVVTGDFAHANTDVVINKDGADVTNSTMFFKAPSFKTHVYAYLFSAEGENVKENAPYPGVELKTFAKVLDIYAFESSSSYEKVVFSWKDAEEETIKDGNKTEDIVLPAVDANTPYYDNGWKALPNIVNAETTGKTVYINHWNTSEKVYAYAFTYNEEKNAEWPGVEMTRDPNRHDKLASYTFDKDYYYVIFNNGNGGEGNQTDNLLLSSIDFASDKNFYNVTEDAWTVRPEDNFTAPTSVGLKGSMNGWTNEFAFTASEEGKVWTLENQILMANDEFKFTINGEYALNYSNLSEEDKANFNENKDYQNIIAKESAYYAFVYNAFNNTLSITKGEAYNGEAPFYGPISVGLIGSFGTSDWATEAEFMPDDEGKIWTLENIQLNDGDLFKVRLNDVWGNYGADNYGYDHLSADAKTIFAKASENGENVEVTETANYTIIFNAEINEIDAEKLEPVVPEHQHTFINNGPTCDDETCDEPNPNYVAEPEGILTIASISDSMNINELGNFISITDSRTEGTHSYTYEVTESKDILDVDANGKITAKTNGTATIKVKDTSNDSIESNEITVTVNDTYRVYFLNNWVWDNPNIYFWGSSKGTNPAWPGNALTKTSTQINNYDLYYYDIPTDVTGLIFNGNNEQSEDFTTNIIHIGYYEMLYSNNKKNAVQKTF